MTTKKCCKKSTEIWLNNTESYNESLEKFNYYGDCKAGMFIIECGCCGKIIPILITRDDGHFKLSKRKWNKLFRVCNKTANYWVDQ